MTDLQAEVRHSERLRMHAWTRAAGWFAVLVAAQVVLLADVVLAMATTWWNTTTYNHGFLILPISLVLIWLRRDELRTMVPRQEPLALFAVLAFSLGWLVGRAADVMTVQYVGLIGSVISLFLFAFGRRITARLAFPLLFLFFMVPVGDILIPPLQQFTAAFSVALLRLVGIPVFHDGILITTPNGLFEVAEACAGIRFLIANVVIATLFAYLAYRTWWKWVLFLALAFAVPIVANGLRAFGIMLVAHATDNRVAAGVDHVIYGWGFFAAVMVLLLLIGNLFADRPIGQFAVPPAKPGRDLAADAAWRPWRTSAALLALLIVVAAPAYALTIMRPPVATAPATGAPPAVNPAWTRLETSAPAWRPQFPGADRILLESYGTEGATVDFFVAYYTHQRQGAEVVYYANAIGGETWRTVEQGRTALHHTALPAQVRFDRLAAASEQRLVLSWYWVDGAFTASPIVAKLLQVRARLFRSEPAAAVIAVAAAFEEDPEEAKATIERFLDGMVPLPAYLQALGDADR